MTGDSRERGMFSFLFRKKKEVQPDQAKNPVERENPAAIPGIVGQDLDGLMKRIGISSQGKDNGSIPDRKVTESNPPSGPPSGGKEVPEQQMKVVIPEASTRDTSKGQAGPSHQVQESVKLEEEKISPRVFPPPSFRPAKKVALTPKGEPEKEESESVDDIDDLSGLILPKGATFKVDEIRLTDRSEIFKLKGIGIDVPGKDLQKSDLLDSGLKSVTAVASEVQAEAGTAGLLKKFNPLSVIHKVPVEYNARTHGPLVDLTFRPRPGVEQIELYPVNEPYAYVRITYDNATHEYTYEVLEPKLTPAEADLFKDIKERIFERLDLNTQNVMEEIARKTLRDVTDDIIRDYGISLTPVQRERFSMQCTRSSSGMV